MLRKTYSLKALWTKIGKTYFYKNEHIYLNQLEKNATDENIDVFYTLLSNISNICDDVINSYVPKNDEKFRQIVKDFLLESMLDVQVPQLSRYA